MQRGFPWRFNVRRIVRRLYVEREVWFSSPLGRSGPIGHGIGNCNSGNWLGIVNLAATFGLHCLGAI